MQTEFSIEEVEDIKAIHIKRYIQHLQQLAEEKRVIVDCMVGILKKAKCIYDKI
ncbi:hypothetical protein [Ornithinibacillus bavariensis]|uniref:hypothetical protein n=1 Tax=Ornithinibacillus bavariensis TaxID=545502 RepID=UPI003D1A9953